MALPKSRETKKVNLDFNKEFIDTFTQNIERRNIEFINQTLKDLHEADVANLIENLNPDTRNKLIEIESFNILTKNFIQKFNGKIINIHPSLLPKYKGLNTHQRAIDNKERFSGCTVHLVNSKLDSGKIILQKKVRVYKTDSAKELAKKILKIEHILYPKAIIKLLSSL